VLRCPSHEVRHARTLRADEEVTQSAPRGHPQHCARRGWCGSTRPRRNIPASGKRRSGPNELLPPGAATVSRLAPEVRVVRGRVDVRPWTGLTGEPCGVCGRAVAETQMTAACHRRIRRCSVVVEVGRGVARGDHDRDALTPGVVEHPVDQPDERRLPFFGTSRPGSGSSRRHRGRRRG